MDSSCDPFDSEEDVEELVRELKENNPAIKIAFRPKSSRSLKKAITITSSQNMNFSLSTATEDVHPTPPHELNISLENQSVNSSLTEPFQPSDGDSDPDYSPEQRKRKKLPFNLNTSADTLQSLNSPLRKATEVQLPAPTTNFADVSDAGLNASLTPMAPSPSPAPIAGPSTLSKGGGKVKGLGSKTLAHSLREKGKDYLGYKVKKGENKIDRIERTSRKIKNRYSSEKCKKSSAFFCNTILEDIRQELFEQFWQNMTWDRRKAYVSALVDKIQTKRPKNDNSRRNSTFVYHLKINDQRLRVCKNMFLATFAIGEAMVHSWVAKGGPSGLSHQKVARKGALKEDELTFLEEFIDMLPKLPSHYCRKSSSKLYLEANFEYKTEFHNEYKRFCVGEGKTPVALTTFRKALKRKKVALFSPKKDWCDTCSSHKAGNVDDVTWRNHMAEKDRARAEKDADKERAKNGEAVVLTMDLQAVQLVPYLNASALYYRTKLVCHNFTVYDLTSHAVMCYWFTETATDLTASTFISCLEHYLKTRCVDKKVPIIIYSDGCTYQNRNAIMSSALSNLAIKFKLSIEQKFLIKGHTQMECDSVHSAIGRKVKKKEMYLPSDYLKVTREARKKPFPYEAELFDFSFFKDYTNSQSYTSIRPGNSLNDPKVTDLRLIAYYPDGSIKVKTSFDGALQALPRRRKQLQLEEPVARKTALKISQRKYDDLQYLKSVLPADCHSFFDLLPH